MNYGQKSRPLPRKINAKKARWLSEKPLQIAEKRREMKGKGERERYPTECKERLESLLK